MSLLHRLLGENNWKETVVKDLLLLTVVDGDMDRKESSLVFKIAIQDLGFSEHKLFNIIENIEKIKDIYPTKIEDKFEYIKYLLQVTFADDFVDENEIEYIKEIAKRMELPTNSIDKIITNYQLSINKVDESIV